MGSKNSVCQTQRSCRTLKIILTLADVDNLVEKLSSVEFVRPPFIKIEILGNIPSELIKNLWRNYA